MLAASLRTVFAGPNPSASFARLVWRGLVLLLTLAAPAGAQTAAPEITSGATFSVKENATAVATLTATDTDAARLRWSIPAGMAGGADGAVFSLIDDAGVLTFSTAPDYETPTDDDGDNVYEVTVQVSDGTNTDTAALEVTVTNVAEGVPNIVIILADDLGYGDIAHLNPQSQIPTPNLDALAQAGMAFLDAHTPSSVCTPTRYGLLTGRYAWRTRLKKGVLGSYNSPLLTSGRATLGSLLKAEGYRTAAIGKWHLGLGGIRQNGALQETVTDGPHTYGFDESYIIPASVANPPYVYIRDGRVTGFPLGRQAALSFPRFIRAGEKGSNFDPAGVLDELIGEVVEFIEQQAAGVGAVARFATTTATRRRKRRASCSAPPGPPRRRATSTPRTMWIILRSRCRRPGCWRLRRAGPPIRSARCGSGALVARADGGGERQNFRLRTPVTAAPVMVAVAGQGGTTGAYTLETRLLTGYLENPGPASFQSGIGVISGWTCDAEMVEIALNRVPQEAAYGTERLDTEPVCGDVDNGFGLLFNWNRLGDGEHEVVALVDGVELGRATVQVTTVGAGAEQEFLREAEGECSVEDFPMGGQTTTLVWQQSSQNFVIADVE